MLSISGSLSLVGTDTLTFDLVNGAALDNLAAGTYEIASYTGSLNSATFATNGTLQANWMISYATSDEVNLVVTAVPEPGSYATVLGGLAFLMVLQRMRRGRANPFSR
jgi:hypothetical protein